MIFLPLGGAGEIGANSYYLNLSGTGIILDCGMHPRKTGSDSLPDLSLIENRVVDYVLITHAHQDHIGSLPFLIKKFPYLKIISTPQTRAIAELTLHNSVEIVKDENDEQLKSLFNHDEIDLLIQSIEWKEYGQNFLLKGYKHKGGEINATFYDAGHIPGSASILIKHNNIKIFFTGDINTEPQIIIKEAELPETKIDILITETTYGSTDSTLVPTLKTESQKFAKAINRIANDGGSILIPVFSLGKMQEMSALCHQLIISGTIPDIDIYTGGIGNKISKVYDYNRFTTRRNDTELILNNIPQKNLFEVDDPMTFFKQPCIVLASSGMMMPGTASYRLARHWVKQKKSAIVVVGYMDSLTPGYVITNSRQGDVINLFGNDEIIKCEILKFRFPSHARREGLLKIADRLKPEKIILVHGEEDSIKWVGAELLKKDKGRKVYSAEAGKEINLSE
ncbi:MAG: MBL fold metallo-hydrolase [Ignavibacteriales bacterium]|nr:MAG: MBL fold metallo-hydrolase [Ignavibacteriales bacterium]